MKRFILGFIIGGVVCSAFSAIAVEYSITENPFPIKVNGQDTIIEGYNINNSSYFKLRDVADAVGGFDVGFDEGVIRIITNRKDELPVEKQESTLSLEPQYETINGKQYISASDADKFVNEVSKGIPSWAIAYNTSKEEPEKNICCLRLQDWSGVLEEYKIETDTIDLKQYILKEVFEQDVISRIANTVK